MADVVPITTLLAILICIGYCSHTAWAVETSVERDEPPPLPKIKDPDISELPSKPGTLGTKREEESAQLETATALLPLPQGDPQLGIYPEAALKTSVGGEAIKPESESLTSGLGSTRDGSPDAGKTQLDPSDNPSGSGLGSTASEKTGTAGPEISVKQSSQRKPEEPIELLGGQQTQQLVPLSAQAAESKVENPEGQKSDKAASPGVGGTGHVGSQQQASLAGRPTGLVGVGQGAPAVQSTPDSTPSDGGPSVRTETTTTTDPAHTSAAGRITQPVDTAGVQDKTKTKGATLSSTTPRAGDVKVEIPLATEETAPVETPAPLPGAALTPPSTPTQTTPQQSVITPVSKDTTPDPTTAVSVQHPSTTTTVTKDTRSGAEGRGQAKVTPPVDTAGTLPGTTDSHTTRQGPSPPAGASQASADVTVQQGPTPEEKKEQQKEVTGITPQGSPRQEGQQQKGQTPQGPPPLGSTSGATPGKDNTRETAKTPPTGTDTNNNNNNITIPKIAVNETIISATVVPSAIPAVLVCSVVFLYLSRR